MEIQEANNVQIQADPDPDLSFFKITVTLFF